MKKSILLITFLISGFFLWGVNNLSAQWCFTVTYNDNECNCGTLTAEKLSYYIYDLVEEDFVVPLTTIDLPGIPIEIGGTETILWDAQDRYYVYVRITYYDPTECCGGWDADTVDGQDLIDCEVFLDVIMD
jgi:voltage-gated potassium channel Kch